MSPQKPIPLDSDDGDIDYPYTETPWTDGTSTQFNVKHNGETITQTPIFEDLRKVPAELPAAAYDMKTISEAPSYTIAAAGHTLRIDKTGLTYNGTKITDTGELYTAMSNTLKAFTEARVDTAQKERDTWQYLADAERVRGNAHRDMSRRFKQAGMRLAEWLHVPPVASCEEWETEMRAAVQQREQMAVAAYMESSQAYDDGVAAGSAAVADVWRRALTDALPLIGHLGSPDLQELRNRVVELRTHPLYQIDCDDSWATDSLGADLRKDGHVRQMLPPEKVTDPTFDRLQAAMPRALTIADATEILLKALPPGAEVFHAYEAAGVRVEIPLCVSAGSIFDIMRLTGKGSPLSVAMPTGTRVLTVRGLYVDVVAFLLRLAVYLQEQKDAATKKDRTHTWEKMIKRADIVGGRCMRCGELVGDIHFCNRSRGS